MNNSKIRLGISLRVLESQSYKEKRDALSHDWPPLLEKLNVLPIFIPNTLSKVEEFLNDVKINGLLLSGGDNIGDNPERDICEKKIIDFGIKNRIPIFGVCRGMQVLNNYFGGSIIKTSTGKHVSKPHRVNITNSNISSLIGKEFMDVNSFHNNVITKETLGHNLEPFAIFDDDKTIEGFFHTKLPILAVMWHPERNHDDNSKLILRKVYDNNFWKNIL